MQKINRLIICVSLVSLLSGCFGDKVASYYTESQRFSWGSAYALMHRAPGSYIDDIEGEAYLSVNLFFDEKHLNKNCEITANHVRLTDLSTKAILIDQTPTFRDGTPFTRPISKYKTSHFSFRDIVFEYKQSEFPYDLKIKMTFQCPNETVTTHNFDQKLKFRMVYPTQRL